MKQLTVVFVVLGICVATVIAERPHSPLVTMGEEHFGNKPLEPANYSEWANVMNVVNDKHRVYHSWVNGDDHCYFRGDTDALNTALKHFANIDSENLELVLRPGPGIASTFSPDKKVPYDWHLQLVGGIAAHMATRDKGELIWATHPIMMVRVGGNIDLDAIVIPDNVTVLELGDLKQRYMQCLSSIDQTVRGWSCGRLAVLDPYDEELMHRVTEMLADDSSWVRLNAVGALRAYGNTASTVLDKLRPFATGEDEQLRKQANETVKLINAAKANPQAQQAHNKMLAAIQDFCKDRK